MPPEQDPSSEGLSFWAHKPGWCQPWSILSTGVLAVGGSWWLLHRWWISLPVAVAVVLWWGLFLVLVPAAWRAEQPGSREAGEQRL